MKILKSVHFRSTLITLLFLSAATALGSLFRLWNFPEANVVVAYLLFVLLISRFTKGYVYGIVSSVLSFLMYNWFFTEPYYTFKVDNPSYFITFAVMTITAIATSALTTKVKQTAAEAREKEMESNALYQLTNHLTDASDSSEIAGVMVLTVSKMLSCNAACVCFEPDGSPEKTFLQQKEDGTLIHREIMHPEELKKRMEQLHMPYDVADGFCDFPVYGSSGVLAVLRIPEQIVDSISKAQMRMLHSVIESSALAFERYRSQREQAKSREETVQERYRSNLLRAISHDLRTPLSGIMGTSEMLMGMTDRQDMRYELAKGINDDAVWLHSLVENILNMTKFQDGHINLKKEPEIVEEVMGVAMTAIEKRAPGREIKVSVPDSILMVPMDAELISQVLVNLIDNALKHTPEDKEISVSAILYDDKKSVRFAVEDRGCGIADKDLPKIFQMFYTTGGRDTDTKKGVGLGLSICMSIVRAHGGTIYAENRKHGGARFVFTLPMGDDNYDNAERNNTDS